MNNVNEFPRRNRLDLNEPAELSITCAAIDVERLGADERLTKAVTLLMEAKNLVSDFIDDCQAKAELEKDR